MPSKVRRWTGSAWQENHIYRWDGSAWKQCNLYRWNGSAWVQIQGETWFFNNGDKFTAVTGGWNWYQKAEGAKTAPTQLKNGTTRLYMAHAWDVSAVYPINAIDLTNISTISAAYITNKNNTGITSGTIPMRLAVRKTNNWDTFDGNAAQTQLDFAWNGATDTSGTITLNVANLTGVHYMAIQTKTMTSGNFSHAIAIWADSWFGQ